MQHASETNTFDVFNFIIDLFYGTTVQLNTMSPMLVTLYTQRHAGSFKQLMFFLCGSQLPDHKLSGDSLQAASTHTLIRFISTCTEGVLGRPTVLVGNSEQAHCSTSVTARNWLEICKRTQRDKSIWN